MLRVTDLESPAAADPSLAGAEQPPYAPGRIWVEQAADGPLLHLDGDIDAATVAAYEYAQGRAPDGRLLSAAVVDASAVTFLSTAGVVCVARATVAIRAAGRRPVLRSAPLPVLRVLARVGVLDLFEVPDPLASAHLQTA